MAELQKTAAQAVNGVQQRNASFADVTSDMDFAGSSVEVSIDRDQAAIHGVSISPSRPRWAPLSAARRSPVIYAAGAECWVMLVLTPQYRHNIDIRRPALYFVQRGQRLVRLGRHRA